MLRRARPLLGTLVEIGCADAARIDMGFAAIETVQRRLSRFDPGSGIARFNAAAAGAAIDIDAATAQVLAVAADLCERTDRRFDISLGTGANDWGIEPRHLIKHTASVRLDLGGIGKGHAVDAAVAALQAAGMATGWVNAGGDLRVWGDLELPVSLRDETTGGVRPFIALADGALATSHYAPGTRCRLHGASAPAHVSVAAPSCLWADALTKVAALQGEGPALRRLMDDVGATAWWH